MTDKRQLLSCLPEGLSRVPGLPYIPMWDIHRSCLGSVRLDAPCFQSMLLPVLCPFHCPGGGHCPCRVLSKGCPGSALHCPGSDEPGGATTAVSRGVWWGLTAGLGVPGDPSLAGMAASKDPSTSAAKTDLPCQPQNSTGIPQSLGAETLSLAPSWLFQSFQSIGFALWLRV